MRRSVLLGAICLIAFALSCKRSERKAIAVIAPGRSHVFWQSIHAGAAAAGKAAGMEIIWNAPATETDYSGQLQIVEAMINRRVDAIAVAPIDKRAMARVVEKASGAGIPVIIYDTGVDTEKYVAHIATDNYAAGRLGARRMGQILNKRGKVLMVACQPGSASTLAREQGFEDELRENFPGIQIVDKRFGMADFSKSLAVAENMLTAHPDADGMLASNETSSVGAAQALKERGNKVKMVGFDWSPTLLEDLRAGLIDSLVVQDPYKMGYDAVALAVRKLRGETPPKKNPLPPLLITKENVDAPDVSIRLHPKLEF